MFASHSQIVCTIFGVNIYYYGIVLAAAILAGTFVSEYIGTKFMNLKKELILDLVILLYSES